MSRLIPASLRGRLLASFVALGLATWLGVGLALFVALRGLHAEATTARLADVTVPLVARARADLAAGMTVPAAVADLGDRLAGVDVGVYLQLADGRSVQVAGPPATLDGLAIDPALPAGGLDHGSVRALDGTTYAWVASVLRAGVRGGRALVAATPDRSSPDALRDVLGTLPLVVGLTLALGILVATLVARSVTGPLRRLADATARVTDAADDGPPLPDEGPTEVRELTRSFERMRAEVAAARQRERRLLADLRHDLRTPLTVIAGFADALRDGTAGGEDADRAAAAIAAEAARMADLVADIGAIEDLAAGRGLRPEPLSAAGLVEEAAARMSGAAAARGVELATLPSVGDTTVTADRRAVERILANLVDNALTALAAVPARPEGPAGPGGAPSGREAPEPSSRPVRPASLPGRVTDARRGHVWLEARAALPADPAGGVLLIVTDDGPGFAPGLAERAFDRFVRGDPARTGPGSGLGLAIVRDLALAHGGAVSAENVAPQGARLTVQLPRVPLAATGVGGPGGHDASRPDGLPAPYEG